MFAKLHAPFWPAAYTDEAMRRLVAPSLCVLAAVLPACRDVQSFSTSGDHFEGAVISADFVRAGVGRNVGLCLTLDTDHLQNAPGSIWTSDGRFEATPLRPVPQIWHDPLSTLSFGDGRTKNLVYVATPAATDGGDSGGDVLVVVSLMDSGGVEVRFLRGAPAAPVPAPNIFAVFTLQREPGACPF